MKPLVLAVLMTASLAACGSKAKKDTTPSNKAEMGSSATGGASYGNTTKTPQPTKPAADPCNGGGPM
jgi:predicted small lipoprotein YifL